MKVAFAVFALLALVSAETHMSFDDFVVKFEKTYANAAVRAKHEAIYAANLQYIDELNAAHMELGGGRVYGVNKFADWDRDEFDRFYKMPNYEQPSHENVKKIDLPADFDLPTSFDWRNNPTPVVTPVYNQGDCGSCWAFSTTEEIESQWALAGNPLVSLSVQQIVDCDVGNGDMGCEGGDTTTAYAYVEKAGGLVPEADYPYTGEDGKCTVNDTEIVASISNWAYVTTTKNETEMQVGVMNDGPLSICVDAATWQFYIGGVIEHLCGQSLDHCVMITGFGNEKNLLGEEVPVWNVRNSWGSTWGEEGYLWVERGKDLCGIADEVTIAII